MARVRFNVNVLGYEPGDETEDLPKEWEDRLLRAEYVEKVAKKNANKEEERGLTDEMKETSDTDK